MCTLTEKQAFLFCGTIIGLAILYVFPITDALHYHLVATSYELTPEERTEYRNILSKHIVAQDSHWRLQCTANNPLTMQIDLSSRSRSKLLDTAIILIERHISKEMSRTRNYPDDCIPRIQKLRKYVKSYCVPVQSSWLIGRTTSPKETK